jgi:hypothetical protein
LRSLATRQLHLTVLGVSFSSLSFTSTSLLLSSLLPAPPLGQSVRILIRGRSRSRWERGSRWWRRGGVTPSLPLETPQLALLPLAPVLRSAGRLPAPTRQLHLTVLGVSFSSLSFTSLLLSSLLLSSLLFSSFFLSIFLHSTFFLSPSLRLSFFLSSTKKRTVLRIASSTVATDRN